jgi:HAE1 family hydrophobic/amphiphilic exporter-1
VVDDAIVVIENVERVIEEEPDLSIPDATKKAMSEITAPIIAISLVLLSVFVPVAFIPGISGQLFRQFAVAVSTAMIISAINALTLSPALCSVLLKRGGRPFRPMRVVLGAIDWARDGYVAIVRRLVRFAVFGLVIVAVVGAAAFGLFRITPQGFLPAEDQGAFFAAMRLPEGASLNRTAELVAQVEDLIKPMPGVQGPMNSGRRPSSRSTRSSPICVPSLPPSRAPSSFPSTCRRSWAWAAPVASSTCCRPCRASRRPTSRW